MIEISQDEMNIRLNSPVNVARGTVWNGSTAHVMHDVPRGDNYRKLGEETKLLIGTLAKFDSRQNVAEAFGITPNTVSNISSGCVDSDREKGHFKDPEFIKKLSDIRESVAEKALGKVMDVLQLVTDEKLSKKDVTDVATIAKDLSVVVRNVSGDNGANRPNIAQVVLFAPNQRRESSYDTMTIEAKVS